MIRKMLSFTLVLMLICANFPFLETRGTFYRVTDYKRRLEPSKNCDVHIKEEDGIIQSPGFPLGYPPYISCTYTIEKSSNDVCEIKLTFNVFQVTETPNCKHDYLQLMDNRGWAYKVCGILPPNSKKFVYFLPESSKMTLKFRSGTHPDLGFSISVRQLRNSCFTPQNNDTNIRSCNQIVRGRTGSIKSAGYPGGYRPGEVCTYTIHKSEPRACRVELDFVQFDLEHTTGCVRDYLVLPDGSRVCGTIGSVKKYLTFQPNVEHMVLVFHSGGYGKGFDIKINQLPGPCMEEYKGPESRQCDQEIRAHNGTFTSPGFPKSFGPNYYCTYKIWRTDPSVCRLELQFEFFDVGHHSPKSCSSGAYLELPGRMRVCQPFIGNKLLEASEFQDPVVFHFASDGHSSGKGFRIHINQIPNTCREYEKEYPKIPDIMPRCFQEVTQENGFFVSPQSTMGMSRHQFCEFLVRKFHPTVCAVILQISVRSNDIVPCTTNYVELPNGERMCIAPAPPKKLIFSESVSNLLFFYHGRDGNEFTMSVSQLSNSCGKSSALFVPRWSRNTFPQRS